MKGNKKFWLMVMALVLGTLLCTGLTGCPVPSVDIADPRTVSNED